MSAREDFRKFVQQLAGEYQNIQTARLGRLDGVTVETGTPGLLWARQWNGKEIQVHNRALVPSDWDLRVLVGTYRTQPNKWFILQAMEDYLTPAAGGRVAYHHEQHQFNQPDELPVDRKQITALTVRVSDGDGFIVRLYGDAAVTPEGLVQIYSQDIDLSSYVVVTGAKFINIETDDTGTIFIEEGAAFDSPLIATIANVPVPDPGRYLLAYVLLYEGQSELTDEYIHVPMPLGMVARSAGLQIGEADADTPADGDLFGFWDIVDLALKSITWANIKALFDTLYAAIDHDHGEALITKIVMDPYAVDPPVPVLTPEGDDYVYYVE